MKKTLIAIAAIALAGSAVAQSTVTLGGKFGYAYESNKAGGVKANGFGVTDGNVTFAASEDLGGGLTASASMDVRVRGRGNADEGVKVGGRDATIALSGGFGTVLVGAIEWGNDVVGVGSAGAPTHGLDGAVLLGVYNTDIARYVSPAMGGLQVYGSLIDSFSAPGAGGMQKGGNLQDGMQFGLTYNAGPVSAMGEFTNLDGNNVAANDLKVTRMAASYDLGVAKLGAGLEIVDPTGAGKTTGTILGVSMPLGKAITIGATYARAKVKGVTPSGTKTGYELGAQYDLSKRTNVQVAYQNVNVLNQAPNDNALRIRLMHSF